MPQTDGRRISWADGYCDCPLVYLGPCDEGRKPMDLFYHPSHEAGVAMPVVPASPTDPSRPLHRGAGYAWAQGLLDENEEPNDLEYGTEANGNSQEHVRLAVNTAIRRARARGLMEGS